MTDIHELIEKIEKSRPFKEFNKANPDHYLVHAFCHVKQDAGKVELGYYGKKTDKITVFTTDPIESRPPEEVLKESGVLRELDTKILKIGLTEARELAEKHLKEKYAGQQASQEICILQQAEVPVWNITLVLASLNMLNLRIQADSGEITYEDMRNILDLRAKE
ncbi:hypothetical protein GOV11_00205 [Candidatus Woesearchaeota archaeon]|nr:hypothetical protein [Candidatus Woesearchaeota archaeon]